MATRVRASGCGNGFNEVQSEHRSNDREISEWDRLTFRYRLEIVNSLLLRWIAPSDRGVDEAPRSGRHLEAAD